MKLRRLDLALGAVLALSAAPAQAARHREVSRSGGVRAVLSYDASREAYGFLDVHDMRLAISRHGRLKVHKTLTLGRHCGSVCSPFAANSFRHRKSVTVRNVDTDREPEVVVDLYSRGAHCCFFTQVYDWSARRHAYRKVTAHWGDPGDRLEDLDGDGRPEFVSGDDRFAYAFSAYAFSRFPLRVLAFEGGRFRVVTRQFPHAIRRDARRRLNEYYDASPRDDVRGILAAYAADKAQLGEAADAFSFLDDIAGDIQGYGPPSGHAYIRKLRRFLEKLGYPV